MRALGLDLGSKRIGVAVSDSDGRLATPIEVVHRSGNRQAEHRALADLAEACAEHVTATGRRLSFEWALIHDVNDRLEDAGRLADYARPLGAHVNLIPLNPTPGWPTRGSSPARVREFANEIRSRGGNATIRRTRGTDINAACGQLRADRSNAEERPTEPVAVVTPKRRNASR